MKNTLLFVFALIVSMQASSQEKKIIGTVTDNLGYPLPGVNIIVKGTTKGTQTDFDGNYEVLAQVGDVLTFNYVGFVTKEQTVGISNIISVTMEEDVAMLEEVIVTTQGIRMERRSLGYAVNTPSAAQIKRQKRKAYHNSITKRLQGKSTGINIESKNGAIGASNNIFIRDVSSIKGNKQPLYIVDGVPIQGQYNAVIQNINPKDINKVNVYKGRKAKSLFGNSAKNGCIVITTIQGNYRLENDESYAQIHENSFEQVKFSPLSTFSIDVDKASYSNVRRMINNGQKIPFDAVKIEEMINYFDYNYPQPKDEHPFSINTEVVQTPWNKDTKLVKIGLQGKTYENEELPSSNLIFLIDVSGSMSNQNKLPLLKSAFKLLVKQLREKDKVSIVVYAGAAGVVLEPTSGDQKERILNALDNLQAGGSTAGGQGIKLAYKLAERNFIKKGNNRVILATDGDFNVGASSNKAMEKLIEEKRKSGVFLSVLGFGYGNYKDSKLEILADKGNGNHAYIDNMQEAQKVFGKEFGGTLYTIAKDVKIQVEFNPKKIQAYRLIGYENRLLADEDFIDDTKDAGELGSGHTVTALYEIIPVGVKSEYIKDINDLKYTKSEINTDYSDELFTVKFRYKKPDGDKSIEMVHIQKDEMSDFSEDLKFSSAVALFGMQLRHSKYFNNTTLKNVLELAEEGRGKDREGYRAEFIRLVKAYK
ncbi:MAG: von Willebrand factor type A domain-containing protein [Flavobacteriaceae bacterium]|nr:von Willebrand factor type A domain-containing protein [Flavobacteriaceae bacterium]